MKLEKKLFNVAVVGILSMVFLLSAAHADSRSFLESDKWFSNPVAGIASAIFSEDSVVITQRGAMTHRDKWDVREMRFDIEFDLVAEVTDGHLFMVEFAKVRRSSFFTEPHNRDGVKTSYGMLFTKNGKVQLARVDKGDQLTVLKNSDVAIDTSKKNSISLKIKKGPDQCQFSLIANSGREVNVVDELRGGLTEMAGFVTLQNMAIGMKTRLSDFDIKANQVKGSDTTKPHPVYFLEYFDNEVNPLIHWRYNERTQDYSGVNIYCSDELLANVKYPADRFIIPNSISCDKLTLKTVDIDGDLSDASVVNLSSDEESLIEKNFQRIAVKPGKPYAQLVKKDSGEVFQVRGVNYVRLSFGDHSNFTAENYYLPDFYDPYDTEAMFRLLKRNNCNVARVFLIGRYPANPGFAGYPGFTEAVYKPYVDNLIDLLRKAKKYGIYVLPTFGDGELPLNEYYKPIYEKLSKQTGEKMTPANPYNAIYLLTDGIEGRKKTMVDTFEYIKSVDPSLLEALLAIQCQNELSLRTDQWPFNLSEGKITTANGKTYDMSDADSRQLCMDEGLNYYHQSLSKAVKAIDPELLLAEGAFTLRIVGKDPVRNKGVYKLTAHDNRFPPTATVMGDSGLDIIDIHIYHFIKSETPSQGYRRDMESMKFYSEKMELIRTKTPVIMGEFGAFTFMVDSIDQARSNILSTRDACLKDGLNGYMIWTLDTFEQQQLINALDCGPYFLSELSSK